MTADIPSREGIAEYDVTWPWHDRPDQRLPPGLTCVFRVKNEARNLPWVLPPMFEAVQRVVLVDNLSTDDTAAVGQAVAEQCGAADRYLGTSYPFEVSRAGAEHRDTPADSVHSLTHFYNWSFSHVRTAYSMKWDGDMVLTPEGVATLGDLSWQLEANDAVVVVPRHPLTVVDEQTAWLDVGKSFLEPWIYPMGPDFTFVKAFEWEVREWPERCERIVLPEGLAVELKWLDADEFSHWTDVEDFGARAPRKRREWEVDRAVREGRAEELEGLVKIVAPEGVHVVDYVTRTWLPQAKRPLADNAGSEVRGGRRPRVVVPGPPLDPFHVLDDTIEPILALLHPDCADAADRLPASSHVHVAPVAELPTPQPPWGTIVMVAPDRDAFQRMVPQLPRIRGARCYALALDWAHEATPLVQRGDWPAMHRVVSRRRESEYAQLVRFAQPTSPRPVLAEWARTAVGRSLQQHGGLRVALHGDVLAPPGDVLAIRYAAPEGAEEAERDVPPDVILSADPGSLDVEEHHVIARAPVVVDASTGPLAIGPLDQRILNPTGFDRSPTLEAGALQRDEDGALLLRLGDAELRTTDARGATEQMRRAARPHRGVAVAWPEAQDLGVARVVAGLAMSGVPLVCDGVPAWAAALLGDRVAAALGEPVDLEDELAREEHSVVLRRAALGEFSVPAWRSRVAAGGGLRAPYSPRVSVVMATKREDLLEHALAQVARQRGADLELVFAPHGWSPDPTRVAELAGVPTTVLPHDGDALFGDVLDGAARAAAGDVVLKMDDDDWYGPDFVADLLLARDYSGAEIVGMPAEYLYLEPLDVTVRRTDGSENWGRFVAGGTMMLDRALLREVGGFRPVRRFVDASLLLDVLNAGGRVYRTQGLGYLFRRTDQGHTWQADLDFFLDPARLKQRWDGFHPSRLLGVASP
ncbi:MAG: glycosyltransferase [Nocardioidaceae bacterium]